MSGEHNRPHREFGRCPLGDECPCWQEGWQDHTDHVNGAPVTGRPRLAAEFGSQGGSDV